MSNFLIVCADTSTARRIFLSLPYDSSHSPLHSTRSNPLHHPSRCSNQPTPPSAQLSLRRLARHGALGRKPMLGEWPSRALRRRSLLGQAEPLRSRSTSTSSFPSRLRRRSSVFLSGESGRLRRGEDDSRRYQAKICARSTSRSTDELNWPCSPG